VSSLDESYKLLTFYYRHIHNILSSIKRKTTVRKKVYKLANKNFQHYLATVISTSTCNQIRVRRPAINTWENDTIFLTKALV
jgi:hypothetical protein